MRAGKGGFTLIEVMVALLVVALGMLGAITAVSQAAGNGGYLRDTDHGALGRHEPPHRGPSAEERAAASTRPPTKSRWAAASWKWTMNVTQTQVETIRRIDISVRPAEAKEGASMASVTGFYGTAVAPPGSALISWQGADTGAPAAPGQGRERGPAARRRVSRRRRGSRRSPTNRRPKLIRAIRRSSNERVANMHAHGFTLLEVLVAVVIFAIISVLAYGGFNQLTRQDEIVDSSASARARSSRPCSACPKTSR